MMVVCEKDPSAASVDGNTGAPAESFFGGRVRVIVGLSAIGGIDICGITDGVCSGVDAAWAAWAAAEAFCIAMAIISSSVGIEIMPRGLADRLLECRDSLLDSGSSIPLSSKDGIDIIPRLLVDLLSDDMPAAWLPFPLKGAGVGGPSFQGSGSSSLGS